MAVPEDVPSYNLDELWLFFFECGFEPGHVVPLLLDGVWHY